MMIVSVISTIVQFFMQVHFNLTSLIDLILLLLLFLLFFALQHFTTVLEKATEPILRMMEMETLTLFLALQPDLSHLILLKVKENNKIIFLNFFS